MKIGEFAKKFDLSIETVRYYTNESLLLPIKMNHFLDYNEGCVDDMNKIKEYKAMNFSISEIKEILTFQRVSYNMTLESDELLKNYYQKKLYEIEEKEAQLKLSKELINNKLNVLKRTSQNKIKKLGLPLDSLQYFRCPHCSTPLILSNATVEDNLIVQGEFNCKICDYSAQIDDGIIIFEGASYEDMDVDHANIVSIFDEFGEDFLNKTSAMNNWIFQKLSEIDLTHKTFLDIRLGLGPFLFSFIEFLQQKKRTMDFFYFAIEERYDYIVMCKKILEAKGIMPKVILLCGNSECAPVQEERFDYLMDIYGSNYYYLQRKRFSIKRNIDYLKENGIYFGTYFNLNNPEKVKFDYSSFIDSFCFERIREELSVLSQIVVGNTASIEKSGTLNEFLEDGAEITFCVTSGIKN